MRITHLKIQSCEPEGSSYTYTYLARVKLNLLLSSYYYCSLTTDKPNLTEEQLKTNMSKMDVRRFINSELQNSTQRMFFGSDLHPSELGEIYAKKFEQRDFLIFGKAKYWEQLPSQVGCAMHAVSE